MLVKCASIVVKWLVKRVGTRNTWCSRCTI